MRTNHETLVREIEFLEAKHRLIATTGPTFTIVHRHQRGLVCAPGEEVTYVILSSEDVECALPLTSATLQVFDYIARHRFGLTAAQIASGMSSDPFYVRHGENAGAGRSSVRKFSRRSVKEYIKRIRKSIEHAAAEVGLSIKGMDVLTSEETDVNQKMYRLRPRCQWAHVTV